MTPPITRVAAFALAISWFAVSGFAQSHTHGDMVGTVTDTSVIVWTRTSSDALVSVRYGTSPVLSGAIESQQTATVASSDFIAKIQLTGLQPSTRYYYATRVANPAFPTTGALGAIGTFRTAPPPGSHDRVSFVFSGDIWIESDFGMFPLMQSHQPDFYLNLGDYPIADGAVTLTEYWDKYKSRRANPLFVGFLHAMPWVAIWDDHEVENDWDAATDPVKVANGRRAFVMYNPIPDTLQDIYRTRRWGETLELFLLDCRTYRGTNEDPDVPGKPMLGAQQLAWLRQALPASTALFKAIAISVPIQYTGGSRDKWSAYRHARRQVLDLIADNNIENVAFFSADLHWAASNQLREGVREFMACPIARHIGAPHEFLDPETNWNASELNYGLCSVDPFSTPPKMTVRWYGVGGLLHTEVYEAATPATAVITSDSPLSAVQLEEGPFLFHNSGEQVTLPRVEPGSYRMLFRDEIDADGAPATTELQIPAGADVRVATDYRDLPVTVHAMLLQNGFQEALQGFTVFDDGATSGPSSWFTDDGYLFQSSNVYGSSNGVDEPGTVAWTGDPLWSDYTFDTRLRSHDNDAFGVVFRLTDRRNYYRFSMNEENSYLRLVSVQNGAYRVLGQIAEPYLRYRWHRVRVVVIGNRIRVLLDGVELFDVIDGDHSTGAVGYYCRANHLTAFDELVVRTGDASTSSRATFYFDDFDDGVMTGLAVVDEGTTSGPSNWFESGGFLRQDSNIHDPSSGAGPRYGTMAIAARLVQDVDLRVKLRNGDNDGIGVVFRYTNTANYYRFHMDDQFGWQRLDKMVNGQWTLLWEGAGGYALNAWHRLSVSARGDLLRVTLNDTVLCELTDNSHSSGRCGLYCYASDGAAFEDFHLQEPGRPRAVTAAILTGSSTDLQVTAPASALQPYVLAVSGGRSPGLPMSQLQAGDPRILELNPDPFFIASLTPNQILINFSGVLDVAGRTSAQIAFPALPGLSGTVFYAGGLVLDPAGGFGELLPTVEVVFP